MRKIKKLPPLEYHNGNRRNDFYLQFYIFPILSLCLIVFFINIDAYFHASKSEEHFMLKHLTRAAENQMLNYARKSIADKVTRLDILDLSIRRAIVKSVSRISFSCYSVFTFFFTFRSPKSLQNANI